MISTDDCNRIGSSIVILTTLKLKLKLKQFEMKNLHFSGFLDEMLI